MSTWHQQRNPAPLWHATKWTHVEDAPGRHTCVERFDNSVDAYDAMDKRGGYVLPPSAPVHERPVAAVGLTSYRYKGRYGWIMIGATDHEDALREARRSTGDKVDVANLQVWAGNGYVPIAPAVQEPFKDVLKRAVARSGQ